MGASLRRRSVALAASAALLTGTIWAVPQAAVAAEGTASIAGTISGDEVSLGEGQATAYRYESGAVVDEYTTPIDSDGAYAFTDIPAGEYRIGFTQYHVVDDTFAGWTEWWDDKSTRIGGTSVVAAPGSRITLADADVEKLDGKASYPVVIGTPVVGKRLTATPGVWPAGTALLYEWAADGEVVEVTDEPSFVPTADLRGAYISVTVYGALDRFGAPSDTDFQFKSSWETQSPVMGTLTSSTPVISGAAVVGSKLTATPGTWTSGTSLSYQWSSNGTPIKGATSSTLTVPATLVGTALKVVVTGRKSGFETASRTSVATARIAVAPVPTVSGTVAVGSTLTAKPGTWTKGTQLAYQWRIGGTAVKGATKATFTLPSSAAGKAATVTVTGKNSGYPTVVRTSKATAKVAIAGTPVISGTAQVGKKLTAKPGTWTSGTRLTYQWYANGAPISGATKTTLTVPSNAKGKKVTVKVTGTKSGFATISRTSASTAAVRSTTTGASQVARPSSATACPASHPIKGNQTTRHTKDWIYHVPGGQYYKATHPEQCFSTEAAAQKAGYRKSKR